MTWKWSLFIGFSGDKGPGDEELEVEDDMTTTEATTTTASPPMSNIKLKNTEIMQSMRQMAEMIQQILGQKTPQQSQSTTPRPRQNWKNGQQKKTQSTSSGKHVMMMMPVVSMKNMDPMETQNIAMMGSDKIEHFEPMDDYEDEDEDDSSPEESRNERRWVEKQDWGRRNSRTTTDKLLFI